MMQKKPRTRSVRPEPRPSDCAKCARTREQLEAVRHDFRRAQDHHAARCEQDRAVIDACRTKLEAARDYAKQLATLTETRGYDSAEAKIGRALLELLA